MHNILIIGAGRCSYPLIQYVLKNASSEGWFVTVADSDPEKARKKIGDQTNGRAVWLDVTKNNDRKDLINRSDVVISLLPAHLHLEVAHDCIKLKKKLLTSAYISHEMYRLGDEARDRELVFTGNMTLDPGLDHMSARQDIDELKAKGAKINAFRSYIGGLLAPGIDDNPWHYKFTWNPRNVVLAGQGTAQFLENKKLRYISYNQLFKEPHHIDIPGIGEYEAYANRDTLLRKEAYGLKGIPNIFRGTIRQSGFCSAWDALIQLGMTDGDFPILDSGKISYYELTDAIIRNTPGTTLKERVANFLNVPVYSEVINKLNWLGLFSKKKIKLPSATPALILEHLLRDKWKFGKKDLDQVLIHHEFDYELDGKHYCRKSTMRAIGKDRHDTAMARMLGLPIAMLLKLILKGNIHSTGVEASLNPKIYKPILKELEEHGIAFNRVDEAI